MTYYVLLALFLLSLGASASSGLAKKAARSDRPQMYWDETFVQLIDLCIFPALILGAIIMFLNWKLSLIVILASILLLRVIVRIVEYFIILPLYYLIVKMK